MVRLTAALLFTLAVAGARAQDAPLLEDLHVPRSLHGRRHGLFLEH